MTIPTVKIHDAETGEIIEREMNAEELAQFEVDTTKQAETDANQAIKQAARQAVLDKLGLTADEVAALLG
jgi:hypothetical protein